jgi:hypothetical protein
VLEFLWVRPHLLGGGRIKSFPAVTESSKRCLLRRYRSVLRLAGNTKLRSSGIKVELYPDNAKVAKQFQHADKSLCSNSGNKK